MIADSIVPFLKQSASKATWVEIEEKLALSDSVKLAEKWTKCLFEFHYMFGLGPNLLYPFLLGRQQIGAKLFMGWVDPWVRLCWVGLGWDGLGRIGLGRDFPFSMCWVRFGSTVPKVLYNMGIIY